MKTLAPSKSNGDSRSTGASPTRWRAFWDRWFLVLLLVVALGVQLGGMVALHGIHAAPEPGSDAQEYDVYAWNVAQGRGYRGLSPDVSDPDHPTAYRAPVAPFYYAAIYSLFGHRYEPAYIMNALLVALTVWLVYGIAFDCFGRRAARWAGALYAFYPFALYFNLSLLSEALGAFLVALFVWCCLKIKGARGGYWAAGSGLVLGLLLLCKPGYVFLIALWPFWAWAVCRGHARLWARAAVVPLIAALTLVPWTLRNRAVMGAFIPFSTSGGSLLLQTNNRLVVEDPINYGYGVWDTAIPEYAPALRAVNDEVKRDDLAKRLAIRWLKANPDKWFYLVQGKLRRLWSPVSYGEGGGALKLAFLGYYGAILLGFLAFVVPLTRKMLRERSPALVMHALIAATTLIALAFMGQHRYRFPIDSLLICMTAGGAAAWSEEKRSLRERLADGLRYTRSHRTALIAMGLGAAALGFWWRSDQNRIEEYRERVCLRRMQAVARATARYRARNDHLPATLGELTSGYLPNMESLHCPDQGLGWNDSYLLGSHDARAAKALISYKLVVAPNGAARIEETAARHPHARSVPVPRNLSSQEAAPPSP